MPYSRVMLKKKAEGACLHCKSVLADAASSDRPPPEFLSRLRDPASRLSAAGVLLVAHQWLVLPAGWSAGWLVDGLPKSFSSCLALALLVLSGLGAGWRERDE